MPTLGEVIHTFQKEPVPDLPTKGMARDERAQREIDRGNVIARNKKVDRRRLLGGVVVLGGAVVGSVALGVNLLSYKEPAKKEYEYTDGEPIQEAHLAEITNALKNTGHPFLGQIADHVQYLHTTKTKPAEFPTWVASDFTPYRITVTSGPTSYARQIPQQSEALAFSATDIDGKVLRVKRLESISQGSIELGLPDYIREGGRLAEGYYLAKEHLSHMIAIRMMQEMYKTVDPRLLAIKNIDGSAVSAADQEIAGASVFNTHLSTGPSSPLWRIADGFPALLLSESIDTLVRQNKLPRVSRALYSFYSLGQSIQDNVPAARKIIDIETQWLNSKKLLPPDGISFAAFSDPLYTPVENFEKQIHKIDK